MVSGVVGIHGSEDGGIGLILEVARTQLGYAALPNRRSIYGAWAGKDGVPQWDGTFIDWCVEQGGWDLPSHAHTASALRFYVQNGFVVKRPKIGDLVFFAFSVPDAYGSPHIGVVAEVYPNGKFTAIEAQVADDIHPTPGVRMVVRYSTDVLAFVRPPKRQLVRKNTEDKPLVTTAHLRTRKGEGVLYVQRALAQTVGLQDFYKGSFDAPTRSAYASWQRYCGLVGASGEPDDVSLRRLSWASGLFRTE